MLVVDLIQFIISIIIAYFVIYLPIIVRIDNLFRVNKYKEILKLSDIFYYSSYERLYKSEILSYSLSGKKFTSPREQETVFRNIIKLSIEMMGIKNQKIIIGFFGSLKSYSAYYYNVFQKQIENDELLKLVEQKQTEDKT